LVRIGNKRAVFLIISLFTVSCIAQVENVNSSEEPPFEWVAHPMLISPFANSSAPIGYSPSQIRTAYNLPSSGGAGTTIAIIDAFDTPNILTYFDTFSNQYGLPNNSTGNFLVHKMAQNMGTDSDWALETCLDVEWAHAIAPDAKILLVEAVSPTYSALLSGVDYATSQPGVVAVSMSWGGDEFSGETSYSYYSHFNKVGITFFASSGDDGSSVMWPAVLANVVSVGGTTLSLNPNGTVISETAWRNSSGGLSAYINSPGYQTSFGLNYSNRAVPDVSFNGNPSTGVSVYNGTWWKIGGTSAGAPQWAAINALGLAVTNANLYDRAKSSSSYFRDITSGLNYVNSATEGYDLVTGLGSPLTTNFDTEVTVSPTSGPPNSPVTLNGVGFTIGSSVNISYMNPVSASWGSLINNLPTTSDNFSYSFNAPDLLQNNAAGDNQPQFDYITFRVIDNSNSHSYNTTIPYAEWRRGLNQVANITATGLFGNNTNLASNVFTQNGDSVSVLGEWFNPGNISILWDGITSLGILSVDNTGFFNGTVQVPTTTAGQHTLTLNDGATNFCVNITRLPKLADDYVNEWHTSNFTINLTPDYSVNETLYKINDGPIFNVSFNGQPTITSEGNSTLEYWSIWDVYGTGLNELPHVTLTGIKLDRTPPTGNITTDTAITQATTITLTLSATDITSGIAQMSFSNDNTIWSNWEPYKSSKVWDLQGGDGQKTVSVQFMDNSGLISTFSCTLILQTPHPTVASTPTPSPTPVSTPTLIAAPELISTATPSPTSTSSPSPVLPTASPLPSQTPSPTATPSPSETKTTISYQLPEVALLVLTLFILSTITLMVLFRKKTTK
jgi:hypothetical protein